MKMERLLLAAAVLMAIGLTGCGSGAPLPASQPASELAAPTSEPVAEAQATAPGLLQNDASTLEPSTPMPVADAFSDTGPRMIPAATVAQARKDGVDIVFVDARPKLDYEEGHIPGAINVPYSEPEQHLGELPKDKWIIAYCECPNAEASQVANALVNNGFTKVRVIEDGLGAWQRLGNEVVSSTAESS